MTRWERLRETVVFGADWSFAPATWLDCIQWSGGTISTVEDLYSLKTFGLPHSFRCQCGKTSGEWAVGLICPQCSTWATDDAEGDRRRRMGKINLACVCDHPLMGLVPESQITLDALYVEAFPVCPIAYRVDADGKPNGLGLKYERLVRANSQVASMLPPESDPGYYKLREKVDGADVRAAMRAIIGIGEDNKESGDADSLLPLLWRALLSCDSAAAHLARSCFLTVRVQARI